MEHSSEELPAPSFSEEIMTRNADVVELLQNFVAAKKKRNLIQSTTDHAGLPDEIQMLTFWRSILYAFADHILYQSQITQSPSILQETVPLSKEDENWLLIYVSNLGMNKLATRGLFKFLNQWIHMLELASTLLSQTYVRTISLCFGKSLKRLTSSFSLRVGDFQAETFYSHWRILTTNQQKEFCNAVGRIIVRTSLQMISTNSFLSSKASIHDRSFLALETNMTISELTEPILNNTNLWEEFRTISGEIFCPIPRMKRKRRCKVISSKRKSTKSVNLQHPDGDISSDENSSEDATITTPVVVNMLEEHSQKIPVVEPHCSMINLFANASSHQELWLRDSVWLVSSKGVKAPKF